MTAMRHTMGSDEAACATGKRGTVRCHRPQALNNGSDNASVNFDVDFLVDGTWVHVGAVDFPATTVTATEGSLGPDTAAAASPSSRTGLTGWTSTPYGVMYVAVAPSGSRSMAVEAKWSEGSTGAEAHRPHI